MADIKKLNAISDSMGKLSKRMDAFAERHDADRKPKPNKYEPGPLEWSKAMGAVRKSDK